jgi:hypothetical protein
MKFNDKQLENIARVAGSFCVAAGVGAAVGIARPHTVSTGEHIAMLVASILAFCGMLIALKGAAK